MACTAATVNLSPEGGSLSKMPGVKMKNNAATYKKDSQHIYIITK